METAFLQLLWQAGELALLLHVGSPQSKESDDRMEAKIDAILLTLQPEKGRQAARRNRYRLPGPSTDAHFVEMLERRKE